MRTIIVLLAATTLTACSEQATPDGPGKPGSTLGDPVEPAAGGWSTFVLPAGDVLRAPPPPDAEATRAELAEVRALAGQRDAAAAERVRFWDAGAAYRWVLLGVERIVNEPVKAVNVQRHIALLNVAVHDATIAAWDSKYAHRRPRPGELDPGVSTLVPTPASPSYPSEHAAVAAAAAAVLSHLYPEEAARFAALAEEAGRSRLLAGVELPSDVAAGSKMGREVGARVIERARSDGFERAWQGTVPVGPGMWRAGTPPAFPLAGGWKTWVMQDLAAQRPPPPPAHDGPQTAAELKEIREFSRTVPHTIKAWASQSPEGTHSGWYHFVGQRLLEQRLQDNPPRAARAFALTAMAAHDSLVACWEAKYVYWRIRPDQLDPEIKPLFPTPSHPAYPSGHACLSAAVSEVIAHLFPSDAATIRARAQDNAWSRIWAGIHYRSDIDAGLTIGQQVAREVIERGAEDGTR